jgi:hypothetical protein
MTAAGKKEMSHTVAWMLLPLIVFVWVFLPSPLAGAEENPPGTGNLKGFIYKKDGKTPRWGAQVLLEHGKNGKIFESNVTDAVGDYKLMDIPEGDYNVKILMKDKSYKVKTVDFKIKIMDGKTTRLSFALKKGGLPLILGLKICQFIALIAGIAAVGVVVL